MTWLASSPETALPLQAASPSAKSLKAEEPGRYPVSNPHIWQVLSDSPARQQKNSSDAGLTKASGASFKEGPMPGPAEIHGSGDQHDAWKIASATANGQVGH